MDSSQFYQDARHDLAGPLHGVRVLDVTKVWSGPLASCVLADLGATVIRVEMPGNREGQMPPTIPGTGRSWFRETVHRNKRSIGLDLRTEQGRSVFLRLVATVDMVVENYRPGTLNDWGVGYPDCRAVKPDIVVVSVSGWGQFGPDADRPGYDPVTLAASGWMSLNGDEDGQPARAPTFLADDLAGLHAVIGALAALRHRDQTGEGQHVDVSMLDSVLFSSSGLLTLGACGAPLRRWGSEVDIVVPANTFNCADGSIYLVVAMDKHWRALTAAIGRAELADDADFATNEQRRRNRAAVNRIVARWCRDLPVAQVVRTLSGCGITVAPVRTYAEAACDAHVLARDMLQVTELRNGTSAPLTGPAVKFSRTPTRVRTSAPDPGADTDAVLAELGISEGTGDSEIE